MSSFCTFFDCFNILNKCIKFKMVNLNDAMVEWKWFSVKRLVFVIVHPPTLPIMYDPHLLCPPGQVVGLCGSVVLIHKLLDYLP